MHRTATVRVLRRVWLRTRDEDGFTLTELLIAMAILLVVMTALTSVLVTASKNELDANLRFQVQGQARAGLDELRRELHCASSVTFIDASGNPVSNNPGTSYSALTASLGASCATTGGTAKYVTWCTKASTRVASDWSLMRVTSTTGPPYATCATSGTVQWADYLTTSTPFCLPTSSSACGGVLKPTMSLPMLHVSMPVNINGPTSAIDGYNLVDDIALRNGVHS
jgi:prepilin-type N-terminal cleavage/methylation domain-containing protein